MKKLSYFSILSLIWLALLVSIVYPSKGAPLVLSAVVPSEAWDNEVTSPPDETVVRAVLFYSPTCGHCHYVITEILPPLVEQYGDRLQIVGIDVTGPAGSALYQAAITHYQIPAERQGVPALVVGETVLVGGQEIPENFPGLIVAGLAAGGVGWPDIPGLAQALPAQVEPSSVEASPVVTTSVVPPTAQPTALSSLEGVESGGPIEAEPVYLAYFFDPTCLDCARVSADLVDLQTRYPQLVVKKFELPQEAALNEAMCEKYGLADEYHLIAPIIFIGDECLLPTEISLDRLQALIEDPEIVKAPPPWANLESAEMAAEAQIVERFNQFSLLAIAGAGLLDGVNPCAFTTLIFFVSHLTLVGRKGREILLVGAAFTLAVFLTYLVMGLGLAEVVRQFSSISLIGRLIYGLTALVCLGLAVISLLDYVKIRQGRLTEISLQLPKPLKQRIHQTIRTHSRMSSPERSLGQRYAGAAFGAGILVSLFELACTGQVYLPTIVFVTGVAELRLTALAYLILYNLMFIIPLVVVFGLTYLGSSSRQFTTFFQANAGLVKLFTATLFGLLGIWLGYMVWLAS